MWSKLREALQSMSETNGTKLPLSSIAQLMPWAITAISVGSLIYTVSSVMTGIRMEQGMHDRSIVSMQATISNQQTLLYSINNEVATLNQRFIDAFGSKK